MSWAAVLVALVGCAHVADRTDFTDPPIQVTTDTAVHVIAPTFELDFGATGLHLPEHLRVDHGLVDVLGVDDPCQGESLVGIEATPAVQASAGMRGLASRSQITAVMAGPAVAKIRVTFAVDYDCPNAETLAGTSDFTVFPSGRIVREDTMVVPSSDQLGIVGHCGCQQETNPQNFHDLFFASYWAFDPIGATQVQADGSAVVNDVYAACTMYTPRAIAVAWKPQSGGTNTRYHPQLTASHLYDWPTANHKMLAPTAQSVTSTVAISDTPPTAASDCGKILAALADIPLQIDGTRLDVVDHDGIYRDPSVHSTKTVISAAGMAVPAGFAVSLDLGGASHASISRSPASTRVAVAQRESGNRFVFVFFDGLAPGESITIEPES
jgi:hypothetical protein